MMRVFLRLVGALLWAAWIAGSIIVMVQMWAWVGALGLAVGIMALTPFLAEFD